MHGILQLTLGVFNNTELSPTSATLQLITKILLSGGGFKVLPSLLPEMLKTLL